MKKITFFIFLMFVGVLSYAQSVDEPANWPNEDWTITGSYSTDDFTEDPTTDSSQFSFDDNAAGGSSTDNIAAESPTIDITAAQTDGETLYFTANYVYRDWSADDEFLVVQYWDEDNAEWINWIDPITTTTDGAPYVDYCTGTPVGILSDALDVSEFTATQLTNFKYRIYYDDQAGWGYGFCVSNPSIYSSSCPYPSDFTADNITSDSADLSWLENGSATKWNIEYGETGFTQGGEDSEVVASTVNPFTLEGLEPNTTYDLYVQANCGGGSYSVWFGPITITTECVAFTTPWSENFEASTTTIPGCWSQATDETANWSFSQNYYNVGDGMSASGGYYAYTPTYPYDLVATLNTPLLDVSGLTTPSLSFFFNSEAGTYSNATLNVDFYDGTTWNEDILTNNDDTNGWEYVMINLSDYTITGDVQFRFTVTGPGSLHTDAIAIDDIVVDEYTECLPVSDLAVSSTTNSTADLTWTSNGEETAWFIEYGLTGFEPGSEDAMTADADSNPFTIEDLESNTEYDYYVNAICGDNDTSVVLGPFTFITDCDATNSPFTEGFGDSTSIPECWRTTEVTTYPYGWQFGSAPYNFGDAGSTAGSTVSGGYMAYVDDSYVDPDDVWSLTTPAVDVSGLVSPSLLFYLNSFDEGYTEYGNSTFTVDLFDGAQWQEAVYTNNENTDGWKYVNIDLSVYTITGPVKARFNVSGTSSYHDDIAIDDVTFDEMPDCSMVVDIEATNIITTSVDVSWTEEGYAEMWNIEYGPGGYTQGSDNGTIIEVFDDPMMTIEDLLPGMEYDIYVQSNCESSTSNWAGPITVTTPCEAFDNFIENFDDESYGYLDMVDCWYKIEPGFSTVGVYPYIGYSGTSSMQLSNSSATSDVMLITPELNALSEGTNRARFFVRTYSTNATLEVGTITDPTDPSTFTLVETVAIAGGSIFNQYIVNFGDITDDMHVAIKHGSTATYQTFYIDDFTWEALPTEAPSCATNVVATPDEECGNYANTITWDETPNSDGYYITVGTTSGGTDIADAEDLGSATEYTFEGSNNTTYYYTVTPYNYIGTSECTEYSFETALEQCYCASVPSSNDGLGITNVTINDTDFTNGDVTYADFTETTVTAYESITNQVSIDFATGFTYGTNIWIDFNDDYTFDNETELVYVGESSNVNPTTLTADFVMPSGVAGTHTMRIGSADSGQSTPNPCYNGSWGVTLDFTLEIAAPPCTPATYDVPTTTMDCETSTYTIEINFTDLGDGTPSITDGTTTWDVEIGTVSVGPFDFGTEVSLELLHGDSDVCNIGIGSFNYEACPPSNDNCMDAITLTVGETYAENPLDGTVLVATADEVSNGCGSNGPGVWYSLVVPNDGNVTIETGDSSEGDTGFDSVIEAFTGTCGSLESIECDDDGADAPGYSLLELTGLTAGETIYIRVWEYGGNETEPFSISAYSSTLSTTTFDEFGFAYYPNPVKQDKLTLTAQKEISDVNVFNLLGQRVMTLAPATNEYIVDMSQLTAGTYFVEVVIENKSETIKIIKE